MSALTYGIVGALLVWAGLGSLRKRRWVQPMMNIIGWCWLIVGLFCMILAVGLLEDLYILATSGLEELPPDDPAWGISRIKTEGCPAGY